MFYPGDARELTNWSPNCDIENQLMQVSGAQSNQEYRQWLQHNADQVAAQNAMQAVKNVKDTTDAQPSVHTPACDNHPDNNIDVNSKADILAKLKKACGTVTKTSSDIAYGK